MDILENIDFNREPSRVSQEGSEEVPELFECCRRTIHLHAKNNPMMVCAECKKIIKVFDNEKAYLNYQRFCTSRHRRFLATSFQGTRIITFKNYDGFTA